MAISKKINSKHFKSLLVTITSDQLRREVRYVYLTPTLNFVIKHCHLRCTLSFVLSSPYHSSGPILSTDHKVLCGIENQVPNNNLYMGDITCNCKSMKQTTLEQFWLSKKGRELKIQEGIMSPTHKIKGTGPKEMWQQSCFSQRF
ncbi:hypothetical protein J6590_049063 [Homalodisca vitripennis]|nr:hypothetical protein J6590_049063 [Homalodisca vitripennis]